MSVHIVCQGVRAHVETDAGWIHHVQDFHLRDSGQYAWLLLLKHHSLPTRVYVFFMYVCLCGLEREEENVTEKFSRKKNLLAIFCRRINPCQRERKMLRIGREGVSESRVTICMAFFQCRTNASVGKSESLR